MFGALGLSKSVSTHFLTSNGTLTTRHTSYPSIYKANSHIQVDEILHMKLLESLVDTSTPSTIVLASGDAAESEYSGGFLKNVERALLKGWKVELVAWHDGLSHDYRSKDFQRRWEGKF